MRLWLDARAPEIGAVDAWRAALEERAAALAAERRVAVRLTTASRSAGVRFDAGVRAALMQAAVAAAAAAAPAGADAAPSPVPEQVCFAGHDAGVLAERVPAGMVLVRNPSGVSHSPAEAVDVADAAVAATVVAAALERLR